MIGDGTAQMGRGVLGLVVAIVGLHRPGLALVEILVLWAAIPATLVACWQVRPPAGVLRSP